MPSGPERQIDHATKGDSRLLSIVDSAMDAIITIDESQRVVMFNRAAERIFGVPKSEAIGSTLDRFLPERFRRAHRGHIDAFGRTGVTMRAMGHLGALSGLRPDGSEFPIEASISQALVDGKRLFTVILRDISERKVLEEQLLQSQKMEGIGRLAGGVAHDFNNLLMAILNYITLAARRLEPGHPAHASLAHAREAADRAAMLTRQLLTFARKQAVKPRDLCPRDIVSGVEPMLRRLIGEDIDLRADLAPDTGQVRADSTQLEQVIMNLVINARDAMSDGGTVTIQTRNLQPEEARARGLPGPHVALCVSDTGTGMSPAVRARLFEPFFTTKEPGKGTGLGLATCHGIVRQSGGQISVESELGQGTSVIVLLPRVQGKDSDRSDSGSPASPVGGSETILLVEDTQMIRTLIAEALSAAGYTVLAATNGAEALRLAETHPGRIDLLVTDVVMPEMGGVQLAAVLSQKRARLRVIYMSGYTEEPLDPSLESPTRAFMSKPFTTDLLLTRVRAILNETAT